MNLDIIGISASECHLKEVPEENLLKVQKIFTETTDTNIWCYFNGRCFDLYPKLAESTLPCNTFAHTTRHPNWSIHDCVRNLGVVDIHRAVAKREPIGFYIQPDGTIGPSCTEEGNRPCVLGNLKNDGQLAKLTQKLKEIKIKKLVVNNCPLERTSDFHNHACRFCKEAGLNVSCFTDPDEIEVEFDYLVKHTPKELESFKKY